MNELLVSPAAGDWGRELVDMGKVAYFTSNDVIRSAKVVRGGFSSYDLMRSTGK